MDYFEGLTRKAKRVGKNKLKKTMLFGNLREFAEALTSGDK